jgi:hypothetical protein
MSEIIARVLFGAVFALALAPIMCLAATPYVLIASFFPGAATGQT